MTVAENSDKDRFLDVFFLRHGQSKAQTGEETSLDSGLSESGRIQIGKAAAALKGISFDRILVSPLARAGETAEIIVAGRPDPVLTDERLTENTGSLQDHPAERAKSLYDELCRLAEKNMVQRILLISHALFCSTFLNGVFGVDSLPLIKPLYARLGNGRMGWLRISRRKDDPDILAGWNFSPQDLQNPQNGSFY